MKQVKAQLSNLSTFRIQLVWYALLILEMLFLLRFFMKLMGADPYSYFSVVVYGLTGLFIYPLRSVVSSFEFGNIIFEPTTLLAIIVYWMIALGTVKFLMLMKLDRDECKEKVYPEQEEMDEMEASPNRVEL